MAGRCWRPSTLVRNVRLAEKTDLLAILDLCQHHHDSVAFGALPFSRPKVYQILQASLADPTRSVLLISQDGPKIVGVFLATVSEVSFSEEKVASELAFWLLPDYRKSRRVLDLISAFEYWAKHIAKVRYAILSKTPLQDETERSYQRLGYGKVETNYLKKL